MRVAVVGAGIVGVSAARFLAKRGHRVTLFEQFPLLHRRGSSHGATRIVRRAYPDPFYTACMVEAYPLWAELESECRQTLVREVGLIYFGTATAERMKTMQAGLRECSVPFEVVEPAQAVKIFPQLRLQPGEIGIFTPEAGYVDAAGAMQASVALCRAAGVEISASEKAGRAHLEQEYDAFAVAAGGWIRDFVDLPVRVTLETFAHAGPPTQEPVWIDDTDFCYGIPGDSGGFKIGVHLKGPEIDPKQEGREAVPERLEEIRQKAHSRFGIEQPLHGATGCLYTSTASEDFVLGSLGESGFFASACSGHGFKTGPWVGKLLADFIEGKRAPEDYPRFNLTGTAGTAFA